MARALLSVTDKTGVVEFAKSLVNLGFEILSTGGTAKALREAGLDVKDVSEVTNFPEMLDGRVKTLHPKIHGGLLGIVGYQDHRQQMQEAGIDPIDVLCVNLYAFEKTVTGEHSAEDAIESIDIGGPAMIRAGAKNFASVSVVVDPQDYDMVIASIADGSIASKRSAFAAKAFRHTAFYDSMISRYLSGKDGDIYPETLTVGLRKKNSLRYGENPHQAAALYIDPLGQGGIANADQLWGKELSYNNILDSDAAWELVCDLPPGSCAIIKHGNPCGAAIGKTLGESYHLAKASDPISAFGGIAAFHGAIDEEAALAMTEKGNFLEVVIGSSISEKAQEIFKNRSGWGQDVRLLSAEISEPVAYPTLRAVRGGFLVQDSDEEPLTSGWTVVTERQPSADEMEALKMAWRIIPHVKSNAIVVATSSRLLGVGAGQMNRVQSVRLALEQAGDEAQSGVLASDAFFPFPDSIETAATSGIRAVVQPGGSKKDGDVIAKANELGIAMVFTGTRHFRH